MNKPQSTQSSESQDSKQNALLCELIDMGCKRFRDLSIGFSLYDCETTSMRKYLFLVLLRVLKKKKN
jgi:hypothetical protein